MRHKIIRIGFFVSILAAATVAFAHHGRGGYDYSFPPVTVTGVITSLELINPHAFIYIDVENAKGQVENWALEGAAPTFLLRNGVTKDMLKPGLIITASGALPRADMSRLSESLAYSKSAMDRLKTRHVLQVGNIKFQDGTSVRFGMGASN